MKDLQKDFKINNVIKLEQNYRSQNNILNAANAIIENNSDRLGKNLWSDAGNGDLIRQYNALDDRFETSYIICLLYTSPSPRDATLSRMPSSA